MANIGKSKQKLSPKSFLDEFSRKKAMSNILNSNITTSQLTDALRNITGQNGILEGLKPVKSSVKIVGKAVTAKTSADDWGTAIKAIYAAKKGDIIVITCDNDGTAVWGELASTTAQKRGIVGTVISGACRDISGIKNLNYPVFSKNIVPNAGTPLFEGKINVPVTCGCTRVNPGDLIMGDECGVVSVPLEITEEVLKEAFNILNNEDRILRKLDEGISFLDILGIK